MRGARAPASRAAGPADLVGEHDPRGEDAAEASLLRSGLIAEVAGDGRDAERPEANVGVAPGRHADGDRLADRLRPGGSGPARGIRAGLDGPAVDTGWRAERELELTRSR